MSSLRHELVQWVIGFAEAWSARSDRRQSAAIPPERIAILTAYTSHIAAYGDIAEANREPYVARHGFALQVYKDGFDATRPAAWSKIRFIQQALRRYKAVFWSDADALIMNRDISVASLLTPGYDIFLTETQTPRYHINTGNMLFRSTAFSRLFLELVWRLEVFVHDPMWEQRAINHLLTHYRFRRIKIVPNRCFNAFAHVPNDPDPYQPGDFLVHFPGVPDRPRLMREYAALAR